MFASVVLIICFAFIIGAAYNFFALKKPGIYPPKKVLRKRAGFLAAGGALFLLIGIVSLAFK